MATNDGLVVYRHVQVHFLPVKILSSVDALRLQLLTQTHPEKMEYNQLYVHVAARKQYTKVDRSELATSAYPHAYMH